MENIILSIVICTHRRFELLQLAVNSLCNQTASKETFEVIIVDNDLKSNNEVVNIVIKAEKDINIKYFHEPILGLSQARNSGGKSAKADFVVYMDDDAKAPQHYVHKYRDIIISKNPDIIGGPYIPFYLSKRPRWYKNEYGSAININYSGYFDSSKFIDGMNMCFKKQVLEDAGWFDSKLGMNAGKIWYGEETMLQIIAWKKNPNLKVWYDKDLMVEHLVPSHKMTLIDSFKRSYNLGKSQVYMWIPENEIKSKQRAAPISLLKTLTIFPIKKIIYMVFLRDNKKFEYWQNYMYEEFSKFFKNLGEELQLTKDYVIKKSS